MAKLMRWAVTFAFQLSTDEVDSLTPIVETQDLGLLESAVDRICAAHGYGSEGCIIVDMWRNGDDTEMEMM